MTSPESPQIFEKRKRDHITWSLDEKSQMGFSPSSYVSLSHDPFPELDFKEVSLESPSSLFPKHKPLMISAMTGGHESSLQINEIFLESAQEKNWLFATGSLRRELENKEGYQEKSDWASLCPKAGDHPLFGNLGLAQLISYGTEPVLSLVERYKFKALYIHLNPLQEVFQDEGTLNFKGGVQALKDLCEKASFPVLVKETGSGFSVKALEKIKDLPLAAVDVSGSGGTHWGRVEGLRSQNKIKQNAAQTFKDWGVPTLDSLLFAGEVLNKSEVWASGGLRTGLDAAICFALGATVCGFAQPFMKAALKGKKEVLNLMDQIEYELKVALFCTGSQNIKELDESKVCYGE